MKIEKCIMCKQELTGRESREGICHSCIQFFFWKYKKQAKIEIERFKQHMKESRSQSKSKLRRKKCETNL